MAGQRVPLEAKQELVKLIGEGYNVKDAAEAAKMSYSTARRLVDELRSGAQLEVQTTSTPRNLKIPDPKQAHELSPIARDCLEDFGRFRHRYFGRISSPWQENAAQIVAQKLNTIYKEYGVVNCPPGSGKSTLFTHDIPAWCTARSRTLRGFIGTNTQVRGNGYVGRLRSTLARPMPVQAKSEDLRLGLAVDAASSLPVDYGRFKPDPTLGDPAAPWTQSQLTVVQHEYTLTDEKEATWTAFGEDTGFLGWRVNMIIWDDLVTRKSLSTEEVIMAQRQWWLDEAETRLEPGGLLILQGQRLGAEDLYRFNLDQEVTYDEDGESDFFELGEETGPTHRKYWHIIYKAHYEELCHHKPSSDGRPFIESHLRNAKPYDPNDLGQGCLLDPRRLPWRELKQIRDRPMSNYRVVYQQEDVDPKEVLVPRVWIDGGMSAEGEDCPGCWDDNRSIAQVPRHLSGTRWSIVTVDPSPTKYWAIQWWLYNEPKNCDHLMGNRYLMDFIRQPMGAPELLDWNVDLANWTGLLVEWADRAKKLKVPITHIIVEKNAAQRFLMQYDWFRRWTNMNSIAIIPHSTERNKTDEQYGVRTIAPHYRFGRVRFPGTYEARRLIEPFIRELTRYPDSSTDDCVMANWFMEFQLQHLVRAAHPPRPIYNDMPTWLNRDGPFGMIA